ncbi:DUF962-domain-containing protein [Lenzites betulinus]|nr:DUF962-domain-containing protein [Lenzites betulinus]
MALKLFSVRHQLAFYGTYHNHPVNVAIHTIFVPCILWTLLIICARVLPWPQAFPRYHLTINEWLAFDLNWSALWMIVNLTYYYILEPTAALIYTPEWILIALSSASFAYRTEWMPFVVILQIASWASQVIGHSCAEGRSPALAENLLGALVLAPFFVHIEILFGFGYKPELRAHVNSLVKVAIARMDAEKAAKGKPRCQDKKCC